MMSYTRNTIWISSQGDEVTLTGHQAYWYVRGRNENVFNSSSLRLERQKQFLTTFIAQAKNQAITNPSIAVDLYNTHIQNIW